MDLPRARSKLNMEIVDFRNILSIYPSFRGDFISRNQHSIEVHCMNEQIIYFASFDSEHIKDWLNHLTRTKKFHEWFEVIQSLLK